MLIRGKYEKQYEKQDGYNDVDTLTFFSANNQLIDFCVR